MSFFFFFLFNLVINYWDKLRKSVFKEEKGIFETGINCVVNTVVSSYNLLNRDQNLNSTYNRIHCQKGRRGELMKLLTVRCWKSTTQFSQLTSKQTNGDLLGKIIRFEHGSRTEAFKSPAFASKKSRQMRCLFGVAFMRFYAFIISISPKGYEFYTNWN